MNKDVKRKFVAVFATLSVLLSGCSLGNHETVDAIKSDESITQSESNDESVIPTEDNEEIYTEEDVAIFKVYDIDADLSRYYFMDARDVYKNRETDKDWLLFIAHTDFDNFIPSEIIDKSNLNSISRLYYPIFEEKAEIGDHVFIKEINLQSADGKYLGYSRTYFLEDGDFEFLATKTSILEDSLNENNSLRSFIIDDSLNYIDVSDYVFISEEKLPKGEYTRDDLEFLYNIYNNSERYTLKLD